MTKEQILFIVNPISGHGKKVNWEELIQKNLDTNRFDFQIKCTRAQGDAISLAKQAAKKKIDTVCAIGGDGTVNEVAQGLFQTTTALAIIPNGSGNGLARHLNIPIHRAAAIKKLNTSQVHKIDTGTLNNSLFLCVAGIGFDATIAKAFDSFGKRGLVSYAWLSLKHFLSYKPLTYSIEFDNEIITTEAFLITFANASQFGNNAIIAPHAQTNDGLLDLVIIKPFPFWKSLELLFKVFTKSIDQSNYCESYPFKNLKLNSDQSTVHIDGEPMSTTQPLHVSINPKSLRVVY